LALKVRRAIFGIAVLLAFPTILVMPGCRGNVATPATGADHDTVNSFASITTTPESGRAPLAVSFRAVDLGHAMFGAVTKYNWDLGDGAKAEALTAEHTYTQKGKYVVTLTIFYQDGTQQVGKKTIEVN
jgi:PKD repeat protein